MLTIRHLLLSIGLVSAAVVAPVAAQTISNPQFPLTEYAGTANGDILFFDGVAISVVHARPPQLTVANGKLAFAFGLAEVSAIVDFAGVPVHVYTESGDPSHLTAAAYWLAVVDTLAGGAAAVGAPQEYRSSWRDDSGVEHTVVTPRDKKEKDAKWAGRHRDAVEALQGVFPLTKP